MDSNSSSVRRTVALAGHLRYGSLYAAHTSAHANAILEPPVVAATAELSRNPTKFLMDAARQHPDLFVVSRPGFEYVVLSDASMFEDVLTYDQIFGNPVTPNMAVNKNIFKIPSDQLERHEQNAIKGLRQYLLNNNAELADLIAHKLIGYMSEVMGESGEMDLRELGTAIFWPMTEALFGDGASRGRSPHLHQAFEDIDNFFGKALKGRRVPEVEAGVEAAYNTFAGMVREAKAPGGCPVGPLVRYYDDVTHGEDPVLTAKFSTAAWWGGQGNTLPSTVWTFGMVLADPAVRAKAYKEVDTEFAQQPGKDGKPVAHGYAAACSVYFHDGAKHWRVRRFDYETLRYLTACLKETLRLKTYSIAWREAQADTTLTSERSGRTYRIRKGSLVGLHFCMRHLDPSVHDDPPVSENARCPPLLPASS